MLDFYFLQMRWSCLFNIILQFLILYNLVQLLRQQQIIYVLAYKFILLIYIGWLLIYCDLDIFALILWMVYGGFICIVFILSFMWLDYNVFQFKLINFSFRYYLVAIFIIFFLYNNIFLVSEINFSDLWQISWINYYEVLSWDIEEELEILGWGVTIENSAALLLVSFLLTVVCFNVVIILISARKNKRIYYDQIFNNFYSKNRSFNFIYLRTQNFYIQEYGMIGLPRKHFKLFHRRRV